MGMIVARIPPKTLEDSSSSKLALTRNKKVFELLEAVASDPPKILHSQFLELLGTLWNHLQAKPFTTS